eukprot:NODE_12307_length_1233_cov_3.320976.p1 GENE.NODE_12307_length_1233_cov_3.320976~~NODE_12307_length_1233_cov_3.320976.p1  ORF type:complete len:352 (-),score=88.66 NODE_12307_length_1233_cov_3.320976:48-1103(-)
MSYQINVALRHALAQVPAGVSFESHSSTALTRDVRHTYGLRAIICVVLAVLPLAYGLYIVFTRSMQDEESKEKKASHRQQQQQQQVQQHQPSSMRRLSTRLSRAITIPSLITKRTSSNAQPSPPASASAPVAIPDNLSDDGVRRDLFAKHPSSAVACWKLAAECYNLQKDRPAEAERYIREGFTYAEAAVLADDQCAMAHKWLAVFYSKIGDVEGIKKKLDSAGKIKEHCVRSIALDPTDEYAHHILGRWHMGVASLGWLQKKAASAVAGVPIDGSHEEALACFEKAHAVNARPGNCIQAGIACEKLGQTLDARKWYQLVIDMHFPSAEQLNQETKEQLKQEAKEKLAALR